MIYWDIVIFSLGLQLLIMIINLSFFSDFQAISSSSDTVMRYCATILARVTIELSASLSVHSIELVYKKQNVSKLLPHGNQILCSD